MCESLEHRGPDSYGSFTDGGTGLGVRRLSIIDLKTGDQPVFNEDRSALVILNGEIYNYVELRRELESRGHRFRSGSDTEVIVHLYEEHGADCVRHLRGMFAFAVWDLRGKRLLLGRDRAGKKPLYYAIRGDTLWFGSEVRAMLEDPSLPRRPNHHAIDAYLQLQYVPDPLSAFAGVSRLPAAHTLSWSAGQADLRRYWRLSYARPAEAIGEEDACELIRESLMEATALRLRSDVPVGAFLSGGVDSSAVVAAMARQATGQVRTFSVGFEDPAYDERPSARIVAEAYGTDHHEFVVKPTIAAEAIPQIAWQYGEPFADHSAIPTLQLAALTAKHVKVALTGDGNDENFAGYSRYFGTQVAARIGALPPRTRRAVSGLLRAGSRARMSPGRRQRLERMSQSVLSSPAQRFAAWLMFFDRASLDRLYTDEFRATLPVFDVGETLDQVMKASDTETLVDSLLDADIQTYLVGDLLVKMDVATMAHSLEVRSPLLDQEFMQMAARLPAKLKLRGRDRKHIFKRAVEPLLPQEILNRPKLGFTIPLAEWLRGELRGLPAEVLLDRDAVARGIFRRDAVAHLIDEHQSGRADHANRIWALLQLELWHCTYIDARRESPVSLA